MGNVLLYITTIAGGNEMDSQSSVERFCKVLFILGLGKLSPEIVRKARHNECRRNDLIMFQNLLLHLCQNIICQHNIIDLTTFDQNNIFSLVITILVKFNVIDSIVLKMVSYLKNCQHTLKTYNLENTSLLLKHYSEKDPDEVIHSITYYNYKVKSFELSCFEKICKNNFCDGSFKASRVKYEKILKHYNSWKENEEIFWKWAKLEKGTIRVLPTISRLSCKCPKCGIEAMPYFLLLRNQYLFLKKTSE